MQNAYTVIGPQIPNRDLLRKKLHCYSMIHARQACGRLGLSEAPRTVTRNSMRNSIRPSTSIANYADMRCVHDYKTPYVIV